LLEFINWLINKIIVIIYFIFYYFIAIARNNYFNFISWEDILLSSFSIFFSIATLMIVTSYVIFMLSF
jgi:hypothetical protein